MTKGELLEFLTKEAKEFKKDINNISRNQHLTYLSEQPDQTIIDGTLVAFINFVGVRQGIDYALSVKDL